MNLAAWQLATPIPPVSCGTHGCWNYLQVYTKITLGQQVAAFGMCFICSISWMLWPLHTSLWMSSAQHGGCNLLFCHLKICMLFPRKSSSKCFAWLSEGGEFHPPSKWHHCTFGQLTLPASGEWGKYPSPLKRHRCTFCWLMPSEENSPVPKSDITALFVLTRAQWEISVPVRGITALSSDSSYKVCQDRKTSQVSSGQLLTLAT